MLEMLLAETRADELLAFRARFDLEEWERFAAGLCIRECGGTRLHHRLLCHAHHREELRSTRDITHMVVPLILRTVRWEVIP